MNPTDDVLREAFAARHDEIPGEHPEGEQLWALASATLPPDTAESLVDHLSRCPACAEDFRLTRQMVAEANVRDVASSRLRSVVRFGWALAAALVLAAGMAFFLRQDGPMGGPSPHRDDSSAEPVIESLVDDGAALPREALRLEWTPLPGARYDLTVSTEDLDIVAEVRDLTTHTWTVPQELLVDLPSGTVLVWTVGARLPDGRQVQSSAFTVFLTS